MHSRQLFPLGKAYGDAFCNRENEIKSLVGNLRGAKHTLLIAPRRFGKSSLAERAIEKSGLPAAQINFHLCTSDQEITQLLVDQVTKLMGRSLGKVEQWVASIKTYVANLEPLLAFGGKHASLKLVPKQHANQAQVLSESLLLLEKLLREKNKRAVIFLDEFQEIARISQSGSIEGAFRTAAQEMRQLTLIFSGSVRSLLLSMFEDESRPLYKLCRKIKLERIDAQCYENHLQPIAKATWRKPLTKESFNRIMQLSQRHPYYVNYLCDVLWEENSKPPEIPHIDRAWQRVIGEEWSDALKELADLPVGQRKVLKYIANQDAKRLQSQATAKELKMASSSIATALNALTEKDYIEKRVLGEYEIINPLLLAVLRGAENLLNNPQ